MSAECQKHGCDLVYGDEWPNMFCQVCATVARIAELEADLRNALGAMRGAQDEVERLRAEQDNAGFIPWRLAQDSLDENAARIEELEAALDDEMMLRNQYLEAENARLRLQLEQARQNVQGNGDAYEAAMDENDRLRELINLYLGGHIGFEVFRARAALEEE